MFTGIIEYLGFVESLERRSEGGRIWIRAAKIAPALEQGASIAVNGCCLTVVEARNELLGADLSGETLRRTSLGELKAGAPVNLERPLTAAKELGGHFVQGHVDGVGRVTRLVPEGSATEPHSWWLSVRVPDELGRYVATKGSLAVDGISLTVASWQDSIADFAIIPFTYAHTNVQALTVGDPVNLECDILAKYVERLLEACSAPAPSRLTIEKLIEEGF